MLTISCKKDFINDVNAHEMYLSATPPTVSNGMLYFNDTASFHEYYNYLEELCEGYDDSLLYFDEDSLLLTIESNFEGFTSLRSYFFDETDEIADFNEFLDIVYSHDDILNSILNQYGEMRIGSKVYVIFGSSDFYEIPSTLNSAIQLLRTKDKKEIEIVYDILIEEGVELHSKKFSVETSTKSGEYDNYVRPTSKIEKYMCEPYYITLEGDLEAHGNANPNTVDVEWTIDWGDGTPEEVIDIVAFDTEHNYSSDETFTITVTARWEDYNNPGEYLKDDFKHFFIAGLSCSYYSSMEYDSMDTPGNNTYRMYAYLSFTPNYGTFFPDGKIVAKTICLEWNENKEKWKRRRYKSSVEMTYFLRESLNCRTLASGTKDKGLRKRRKRIVRKRQWSSGPLETFITTSNGENHSNHHAELPDGTLDVQLVLNPCN